MTEATTTEKWLEDFVAYKDPDDGTTYCHLVRRAHDVLEELGRRNDNRQGLISADEAWDVLKREFFHAEVGAKSADSDASGVTKSARANPARAKAALLSPATAASQTTAYQPTEAAAKRAASAKKIRDLVNQINEIVESAVLPIEGTSGENKGRGPLIKFTKKSWLLPDDLKIVQDQAGVSAKVVRATWVERLKQGQGGAGSTPLHQLLLKKTRSSLLAARFLLTRYPGLLLDKYDDGTEDLVEDVDDHGGSPPGQGKDESAVKEVERKPDHWCAGPVRGNKVAPSPAHAKKERSDFYGENCLHVAIVCRLPEVLLFAESLKCGKGGGPPSADESPLPIGLPMLKALAQGAATGDFFQRDGVCNYGAYPLHFAASTGAPLWYFLYLVLRLDAKVDQKVTYSSMRNYTAMHFAVIHGKNESIRYLRMLMERPGTTQKSAAGPRKSAAGAGLQGPSGGGARPGGASWEGHEETYHAHKETPLQLAAKLGVRCTQLQAKVEPPVAAIENRSLERIVRRIMEEEKKNKSTTPSGASYEDPQEMYRSLLAAPGAWPATADEPQPTVLEFLMDLDRLVKQATVWEYGGIRKAYYDVHDLMICHSSKHILGPHSGIGRLLENENGASLLCPPGALDFLPALERRELRLFGDFGLHRYFDDGVQAIDEFILEPRPGKPPPLTESIIPLLIVERAWRRFGWRYVFYEFLLFAALLGLVVWVALDRVAVQRPHVTTQTGLSSLIDAVLIALSLLFLCLKTYLRELLWWAWSSLCSPRDASPEPPAGSQRGKQPGVLHALWRWCDPESVHWRILRRATFRVLTNSDARVQFVFFVLITTMCLCTLSSAIMRLGARHADGPQDSHREAELMAVAAWVGSLYILFYLRCSQYFGRLAVILIKMLLDDVFRLLIIYSVILVGFAVAFHVVMFADGAYCGPPALPPAACSSAAANSLGVLVSSLTNGSGPVVRRAFDDSAFACSLGDGVLAGIAEECDSNPPTYDDQAVYSQKILFKDLRSSLLAVTMMTMSEWKTEAMQGGGHDAISKGLLLFLYATYIIITNLLLLNLLIALLNNTFQIMSNNDMFKAAQIFQRTLVVRGGLERLDRATKSKYELFLWYPKKPPPPYLEPTSWFQRMLFISGWWHDGHCPPAKEGDKPKRYALSIISPEHQHGSSAGTWNKNRNTTLIKESGFIPSELLDA